MYGNNDNNLYGPIPLSLCDLKDLSLVLMPVNNNTCYPSCLFNTLSSLYVSSFGANHCPGLTDIALCKFAQSTNIRNQILGTFKENVTIIESFHPVYSPTFEKQVSSPFASSYKFNLYGGTFLPYPYNNLFICISNTTCVRMCSDNGTCMNSYSINYNPVGGIYIRHSLNYDLSQKFLLVWGFSIRVTAYIPLSGWECIIPPIKYRNAELLPEYHKMPYYAVGICEPNAPDWYL